MAHHKIKYSFVANEINRYGFESERLYSDSINKRVADICSQDGDTFYRDKIISN